MKIASKISLSFVIITTLLISVVVIVVHEINSQSLKETTFEYLETITQSRARHVESILGGYKETTLMISTGNIFRDILDTTKDDVLILEQTNKRIKNILQSYTDISRIRVLDKTGTVIVSSNEDVGFNISPEKIFLEGKKSVYIKEVHLSEFTEDIVISIAAPIFLDDKREFAGVIVVNFNAGEIFKVITNTTGLGETGESYLINNDGYMITPSRFKHNTFLERKINTVNIENCLNRNEETVSEKKFYVREKEIHEEKHGEYQPSLIFKGYREIEVLGSYYPIQEMEWCLLAEVDLSEVMEPLNKVNSILLIIWAGIILVAWGAGSFVARKITKPIKKLRQGINMIAEGDLDYKVEVGGEDEVSQLAGSFNQMTENLKNTTTSLDKLNKEVEDRKMAENKVTTKTKELNREVEKLKKTKTALLNIMDDLTIAGGEIKDLKELDKMKDEFLNVAAHELKTPLTSILGMGEIMLREQDNLDSNQISNLNMIYNEAFRLKRVVQQILTITRFENKKIVIEKDLFNLTDFIESILPTLNILAKQSKSKIDIEQKDKKIEIISDKGKIAEVIYNFVNNAVKYGPTKQIITLRITKQGKDKIKIEVTDQGKGILKNLQKNMFIKFSQLEPSLSRSQEGTGLGLYISKLIIGQLGGKIGVKSEIGKGSTFYFTLPVGKFDEKEEEKEK